MFAEDGTEAVGEVAELGVGGVVAFDEVAGAVQGREGADRAGLERGAVLLEHAAAREREGPGRSGLGRHGRVVGSDSDRLGGEFSVALATFFGATPRARAECLPPPPSPPRGGREYRE